MTLDRRIESLPKQKRCYIEGEIECINGEWIFFDEINERAFQINELGSNFEIKINNKWTKGVLSDTGILQLANMQYFLKNNDDIRIKKVLYEAFQELLLELEDPCFFGFIQTLNNLSYSLYDCIYCHHFLSFQHTEERVGMNTIILDNDEMICTVQHHYSRGSIHKDRFEITKADGSRYICGFW